jgi:hypothetical protein
MASPGSGRGESKASDAVSSWSVIVTTCAAALAVARFSNEMLYWRPHR